ncbi:hypothetical protein Tco_0779650 [Tanacetum coccineum]
MENVGLTFAQVSSKAHREGVGLRVADSYTGNHPEGGFMPFETIRRFLVVIGRRSYSGFEGEAFEPKRRVRHQVALGEFGVEELANYLHEYMLVMDIQERDKNRSQIDITEHENRKSVKEKSSQSQPRDSGFGKSIENRTQKPKLPKVGPLVPT